MVLDLKSIEASWNKPADDTPQTGSGWDAPFGVGPATVVSSDPFASQPAQSTHNTAQSNLSEFKENPRNSDFGSNNSFFEGGSTQPSNTGGRKSSSNSNYGERDSYNQNPRSNYRNKEGSFDKNRNNDRKDSYEFNRSETSSDSSRYQGGRRYEPRNNNSQYDQGRRDNSNQYGSKPRSRSRSKYNNGQRSDFDNKDSNFNDFVSRNKRDFQPKERNSYKDRSQASDSTEPRGRERASPILPKDGLETTLDWVDYPPGLDIFVVLDIFKSVKGSRGILLKIKNDNLARLTFESTELAQQAIIIFRDTNQPGKMMPSQPEGSKVLDSHSTSHKEPTALQFDKFSRTERNNSQASNRSYNQYNSHSKFGGHDNEFANTSRRQEPPQRNGSRDSSRYNSDRKHGFSENRYSHTKANQSYQDAASTSSGWDAPSDLKDTSELKTSTLSENISQSNLNQSTNQSLPNWETPVEIKSTSGWEAPIDKKTSNWEAPTDNKGSGSSGWEAPIDIKKPSNWETPADNKKPSNWEVPVENKKPSNWEAPVENKMPSGWEAPINNTKSSSLEASIDQKPSVNWEAPNDNIISSSRDASLNKQSSSNWDTSVVSKQTTDWEAPIYTKISCENPISSKLTSKWGAPVDNVKSFKWEAPNDNTPNLAHQSNDKSRDYSRGNLNQSTFDYSSNTNTELSYDRNPNLVALNNPSLVQDTFKSTDLSFSDSRTFPATFVFEQQKDSLNEDSSCLAIYNYPSFSPLSELYKCFSQPINELAFVTPTILYLRFKTNSQALNACQDYKSSGRQGIARVAQSPSYVHFISSDNLDAELMPVADDKSYGECDDKNRFAYEVKQEQYDQQNPTENIDKIISADANEVEPTPKSYDRQNQYPTPPPEPPVHQRVKPPTNTGPALRMIAHALGRRPPKPQPRY